MSLHPVALARMYAGISQRELGKRLGRSQSFVAKLEDREFDLEPLREELRLATGLPVSFFDSDRDWIVPDSNISYRKRSGCPAVIRDRAMFISSLVANKVEPLIGQHVKYPEIDVPEIPAEIPPETLQEARKFGAQAAKTVRSHWGIGWGPIGDVIRLFESKGVRVFFVREPAESLDGFACWANNRPFIFLNSYVGDPARLRYDACHELGHIVMHKELSLDADVDLCEAMAHGFAAEFNAPWDTLSREAPAIPDIQKLGVLRRRWKMSMQAIVKHMHTNGAISDAAYTNAFKKFSYLGYRRAPEPGWFIPDSSVIHAKFLDVVETKGLYLADLVEGFAIPETLFTDLVPDSGYSPTSSANA